MLFVKKAFLLLIASVLLLGCTKPIDLPEPTIQASVFATIQPTPIVSTQQVDDSCLKPEIYLSIEEDFSLQKTELKLCDGVFYSLKGFDVSKRVLSNEEKARLAYLIDHVEYRNIKLNTQKTVLDGANYYFVSGEYEFSWREGDYIPRNFEDLTEYFKSLKTS